MNSYEATGNELGRRIAALIPEHPEILTLDSAWGLFKIPGFKCDDLGPSLAQAGWALGWARAQHAKAVAKAGEAGTVASDSLVSDAEKLIDIL